MRPFLAFFVSGVLWAAQSSAPCPTPLPRSGEEAFFVIPDPQAEAKLEGSQHPGDSAWTYFTGLTDSMLSMAATYGVRNVLWVGDIVDSNDSSTCVSQPTWAPLEYTVALSNIQRLVTAGLVPLIVKGNHDECSANWTSFISQIVGDDEPPYAGRPSWVYRIQRASESGNGTDRYQVILYQTTMAGKPLLVVAFYRRGTTNSGSQLITNYQWVAARKAEWLAANPGGHVWWLTHEWFDFDGSYPLNIDPINGSVSSYGNQLKNDPDIEVLWAGHADQHQGYQTKHFGFRPSIPGGANNIRQVDIDYQITSPQTYTVWRITSSGQVDGCAYKVGNTVYTGSYNEATHPTWAPLTRSQGWQLSEWDSASFRLLKWGEIFPMPFGSGR